MQYVISFLEGIITFISPCLLPMIPIYVSYFAGGGQRDWRRSMKCALGFVLGFTVVFMLLGAQGTRQGALGSFLTRYQTAVNIVMGLIVIFFGLHFLGIIKVNLFRGSQRQVDTSNLGFVSSVVFGMVFSIGWTPCVGAFLGSALALASQQGSVVVGVLMLLCYSLGLGIPFIISALLIDRLKGAFNAIKRHYDVINKVCGALLIVIGLAMATGLLGKLLALLS